MKLFSKVLSSENGLKPSSGRFAYLLHLLIVLGACIGGFLLYGMFFDSRSAPKLNAGLPEINGSTRIMLKPFHANPEGYDLSGDGEIVDALRELKYGHYIVGRSIGDESVNGTIELDGKVFSIRAARMDTGGYRVILENDSNGWWEGRKLAKILLENAAVPRAEK